MSGQGLRSSRVASRVHEELAGLLRGMSDPRIAGVLISRVEMSDDLQVAKVFVRNEIGEALSVAGRRSMLEGLEAAGGRLRREIAKSVDLRRVPTLRFLYDEGRDSAYRVEEILREIQADDRRGKP